MEIRGPPRRTTVGVRGADPSRPVVEGGAQDLDEHLIRIDELIWSKLIILGGGESKNADKYVPRLTVRPPVAPRSCATMQGIIGAAVIAAEAAERGGGGTARDGAGRGGAVADAENGAR